MCATLLPSSGKEKATMAAINFANACMSASAQPDCAAFACPATTNIAIRKFSPGISCIFIDVGTFCIASSRVRKFIIIL